MLHVFLESNAEAHFDLCAKSKSNQVLDNKMMFIIVKHIIIVLNFYCALVI